MTQALLDLGPRVETAGTRGKSPDLDSSPHSGAAFADAIDQAVNDARGHGSDRSPGSSVGPRPDHHGDDRDDQKDSAAPSGDGREAIWNPAMVGYAAHGDRADAATAGLISRIAGSHAGRREGAAPDPAVASLKHRGTKNPDPTARGGGALTTANLEAPGAPHPGQTRRAATTGGATTNATTHTVLTAAGGGAQPAPRGTDTPTPSDTASAAPALTANATGVARVSAAPISANASSTAGAVTHGRGKPAAVDGAEPAPARADRGERSGTGTAAGHASYPAASSPDPTGIASQHVSPISIPAPTPVAASVNSTPVVAHTPVPIPFAQAQPDIAGILAQLRGASDGSYQLRARVHPAELGAVAISATVHHGALSVVLTPDQTAQQAISQSLTQLRQHLADQGFTGVNVGLGSPDQSAGHGGDGNPNHAQGRDHSLHHGPDTAIDAVDASDVLSAARRRSIGASALDRML